VRKAISVAVLSLLVGCGAEQDQGGTQTESRAGALHSSGFGTCSVIPGANHFSWRPSPETNYTSASNRGWNVCGTTDSNTILCNYRYIIGGRDGGWAGWTAVTPPSGFTFGASNPTTASWNDNLGKSCSAIAARVNGSSCQNCI